MGAGLHIATIVDVFYLLNEAKEILHIDGNNLLVVKFSNEEGKHHDQLYPLDKGWRQKSFQYMFESCGAKSAKRSEMVSKKLYIAIQEVHYVDDDKVILEDGQPRIEYHIFRTFPYIEGNKSPKIKGNPLTEGFAQGEFITYKNLSAPYDQQDPIIEEKKKPETFTF